MHMNAVAAGEPPEVVGGREGSRDLVLEIREISHRYGRALALDRVSLEARDGEFLTLLGHSGSGKTTLLRLIAGLELSGDVRTLRIAGEDVRGTPAHLRNCTTVFQQYALFPHMTVVQNVEYGLKVRGVDRNVRAERAREALAMVHLDGKAERRPHQLSGGERQRVALARALVTRPRLLLLDEPLGALDEKLRGDMQVELMHLHRELKLTFIYVTHSQEEALTMSDRIILMRGGRIAQEGTPMDLFDRPMDRRVAEFMGVENIIAGRLVAVERDSVGIDLGGHVVRGHWTGRETASVGQAVDVAIRAERLKFVAHQNGHGAAGPALPFSRLEGIYKGKYLDQTVDTPIGPLRARLWDPEVDLASRDGISWSVQDCAVMPAHS